MIEHYIINLHKLIYSQWDLNALGYPEEIHISKNRTLWVFLCLISLNFVTLWYIS